MTENASKPLEDYGLIGNMVSAALVGRDGSIDWLCLPRFDSPACFAAILGNRDSGRWLLSPEAADHKATQRYLPNTAILETRFETANGTVEVIDFMPLSKDEERVDVVRMVRGIEGKVPMLMDLVLRFSYGAVVPWVTRADYGIKAVAGPDAVELHTRARLEGHDMATESKFTVRKGETVSFTLSYHPSHKEPHFVPDRNESLQNTTNWWREWSGRCTYPTDNQKWHEAVTRSLITLKLLTFQPTGGIVAAPTTSLPERIGGQRNWDYRFCWLRDSALTLYALVNSGYRTEAEEWQQWLRRATAGHPSQLRVIYGLAGERLLPEFEIPWLDGYEQSRPVRVGNDAASQVQLDIYGEISDVLYAARKTGLAPIGEGGNYEKVLLEYLGKVWQTPGHGIWEMRGDPRAFTHSRIMCWVAFDRAIKMAEQFGLDGPVDRWRKVRDEIHADVCEHGFDATRNTFTQFYGGQSLDASLLMIPQVGFLPPDDPRVLGTIKSVVAELRMDGLVRRYSTEHVDDGVGGPEGAFLACSFWLADAYALSGRRQAAIELFENLLSLRNHLGLLAEEYDPIRKRMIGNFPQAFSHVGLVNTAHVLASGRPAANGPIDASQARR